jgi:hypothetical protein
MKRMKHNIVKATFSATISNLYRWIETNTNQPITITKQPDYKEIIYEILHYKLKSWNQI